MLQISDFIILLIIFAIGARIFKKFNLNISPPKSASIILFLTGIIYLIVASLIYKLPPHTYVQSDSLPLIPVLVGVSSLSCAVFFFFKRNLPLIENPITKISISAWILLAMWSLFTAIAKYAFLLSIYSPNIYGSNVQIPLTGVVIFIICCVCAAIVLYGFSIMIHQELLWLFYFTIIFSCYQVTVFSLLIAYGFQQFNVSYPFLASIMVLGYVPFILTLFIATLRNIRSEKINTL
jgi:hypothetical protein